jgi:Protein of unknown function (DUF3515)
VLAGAACCACLPTGCAGSTTVDVHAPAAIGSASRICDALIGDLPSTVMGQGRRDLTPSPAPGEASAAAWGDPPIVLRCGVSRPTGLTRTSRCDVVDDVGWFSSRSADGWLFTTIGRAAYVEVRVPGSYTPAANALADVASAITHDIAVQRPCV